MPHVQIADEVEGIALAVCELGRGQQVQDRYALVAQPSGLERRRQEPIGIVGRTAEWAGVEEGHVSRQVVVHGSQSVGHPGTQAGLARSDVAGVELVARGRVVVGIGLKRVQHAQVIRMPGDMRHEVADPQPRLPMLRPGERAGHQLVFAAVEHVGEAGGLDRIAERLGHRFAVELLQQRFVVEGVDLRGTTDQEQKDDRLGLRRQWGWPWSERVQRIRPGRYGRPFCFQSSQRLKSERTEAGAHRSQEASPRSRLGRHEHASPCPRPGPCRKESGGLCLGQRVRCRAKVSV